MKILTTSLLAAGLALSALPRLTAQDPAPPWNRSVGPIAVLPTTQAGVPDSFFDLFLSVGVELSEPTDTTLPLGLQLILLVNGVEVGDTLVDVVALGGAGFCGPCGGGCGGGYIDGVFNQLLCLDDAPPGHQPDCGCRFPSIQVPFPQPVPLQPGDELMVLLRPTIGSVPEIDQSDDRRQETFGGGVKYWDRRLGDARLVPTPGAGGPTHDLEIEWTAAWSDQPTDMNVSPRFEILVNGELAQIFEPPCGPWYAMPGDACGVCDGTICGSLVCNGSVTHLRCQFDVETGVCSCVADTMCLEVIPGLTLAPEDTVLVQLVPLPGALPELPGFEQDDRRELPVHQAWENLGQGLAGTHGKPVAEATGVLAGNDVFTLSLGNALENTTAFLVLGFFELGAPFKGGVMVPDPTPPGAFAPLPTGTGNINLAALWPAGLPSGFQIFVQWWVIDTGGPVGFSASNALRGTTP